FRINYQTQIRFNDRLRLNYSLQSNLVVESTIRYYSLPTIHFPLDKTSLYLRNTECNVPLN
ncbi:unnamed protein product, partial [Callosobruchus maculatus]